MHSLFTLTLNPLIPMAQFILSKDTTTADIQFEAYLNRLTPNKGNNTFKKCYRVSKCILKDDKYILGYTE